MPDPNAWHVVLRDITVILAAASVVVSSVVVTLIAWRLYRLAREVQYDVEPIVSSMQETTEAIRDTTAFVGSGAVSPLVSVIGVASGVQHAYGALRRLTRKGERGPQDGGGV